MNTSSEKKKGLPLNKGHFPYIIINTFLTPKAIKDIRFGICSIYFLEGKK